MVSESTTEISEAAPPAVSPVSPVDTKAHAGSVAGWGLLEAALGIPVVLGGSLLSAAVLFGLFGQANGWTSVVSQALFLVLMGLWAVGVSARRGHGPAEDFGFSGIRLSDITQGVTVGLAMVMIAGVVAGVATWAVGLNDSSEASNTGALAESVGEPIMWPLVLVAVVFAPVAEELYFRGLVRNAIKHRFGPFVGVAGSSCVFALAHFMGGTWRGSVVLLSTILSIGVALGVLAERNDRIVPSILAHATFNGLVVLATLG